MHTDLAQGSEDDRRTLTLMMAQQARLDLGAAYGTKRADPGRPPSKDAIAYQDVVNDKLYAWDWQNGSTREPQLHAGDTAGDITGQVFIVVSPVDHLGGEIPTPMPPTPGPCNLPGRAEMMQEGDWLHHYYKAPEGLQRPDGLWINGGPDWEGIGAWLFDVYLSARTKGTSPADARALYVDQIRHSGEWQAKHPGEQP